MRTDALRILLAISVAGLTFLTGMQTAAAEECPSSEPTSIRGRVVVDEPNKNPPGLRGIGEVFVYAYPVGRPDTGKRKIAVTDPKGHFCIHDTNAGKWIVTSAQPFQFRPFVETLDCQAGSCDLGEIRLDESLLRISDDFVSYDSNWWGGPYAQTITVPSGAASINAITFRSAGQSSPEVQVLKGKTISGSPLARDTIGFPGNPGGSRETAFFEPGELTVTPNQTYTVYFNGSGGLWRLGGDSYGGGEMFDAGGGSLSAISGTDMCLTADVDGPDGNLTSHYSGGQSGAVQGNVVAQQFVARSEAITHVTIFVGPPKGTHEIRVSIGETPEGPAIGAARETGVLHQQPGAFAWAPGAVDVTPGQKYWVRFEFPEARKSVYFDEDNPAGGPLWVDGTQKKGAFWGRVMGPANVDAGTGGDAGTAADTNVGPEPDASTSTPDSTSALLDTGYSVHPDGDSAPDSGADVESGAAAIGGSGCGCHQSSLEQPPTTALLLLVLLFATRRRSRNEASTS